MYYLYFLKSLIKKTYYIGVTRNLDKRLRMHNKGGVKSTSRYKPWKVIHIEEFSDASEVYKKEYHLKRKEGYIEKLQIIRLAEKGRSRIVV